MTTMLTVYRMENARGQGPWDAMIFYPFNGCALPPPGADTAKDGPVEARFPKPKASLRCATATTRQLRRWFDREDREYLAEQGFKVHEYEVPADKAWVGGHQVCFDKSAAKRIGALDPVTLAPISAA